MENLDIEMIPINKIYRTFFCLIVLSISLVLYAQKPTNVSFRQENGKVIVSYTLDKNANFVTLHLSIDNGKTFTTPLKYVTGNVGKHVSAGACMIVWDALQEYEKLISNQVVFKVVASSWKQTITVNGISFDMVLVHGGTLWMGATAEQGNDLPADEKPIHQVTCNDFYIGQTEVTQGLWNAVMTPNANINTEPNVPMHNVTWSECQLFIKKLNELTGQKFRLPTEAEWERAARGGNKSRGFRYAGNNVINNVAWYEDNSNLQLHPVGEKQVNELRIYDMSGNVSEWCQDWYAPYTNQSQQDPQGPNSGTEKVIRGGNVQDEQTNCRITVRKHATPETHTAFVGFRLVLQP